MKKREKPCYFCGGKSNGVEHIPASQIFAGFNVDSITVPSCSLHNGSKSQNDEAIVKSLLMSLQTTMPRHNLNSDVIKAINNAKDHFGQTKKLVKMQSLVEGEVAAPFSQQIAFIKDEAKIQQWMIQLTAGWVWDALKKFDKNNSWESASANSFDYLRREESKPFSKHDLIKMVNESGTLRDNLLRAPWANGWSANPRIYPETIYSFRVMIWGPDMYFQHCFYGSYNWFVRFEPSVETKEKIISLLRLKKFEKGYLPDWFVTE